MPETIRVSQVEFAPAPRHEVSGGLLGWASFSVGSFRLDSVQVRRTTGGELVLSYPGRRSRLGTLHRFVEPLSEEARGLIESQVLATLRRKGVL